MSKLKKTIAVAAAVSLFFSHTGTVSAENNGEDNNGIETYNIAISKTVYNFDIDANGTATCYSLVNVAQGYTVELTMQLQQRVGMWKTVQKWTDKNTYYAALDKTCQVEKGYDYRLLVVYVAYDSEGEKVESFYDVSNIKTYK